MAKRNTKTTTTTAADIDPALIAALAAKLGYVRPSDTAPALPTNGLELAHWYDIDRDTAAHVRLGVVQAVEAALKARKWRVPQGCSLVWKLTGGQFTFAVYPNKTRAR